MKIALTVALFSALVAVPLRAAEAELDIQPVVIKAAVIEEKIVLRFVKPSAMAPWILDAKPREANDKSFQAERVGLPEGVDDLIAVDSLNTLLARGTSEGIERLRGIVALLDKPIPQIEIQFQLVSLSPEGCIALNGREVQIGEREFVRTGPRVPIEQLLADGRAKVISAPRVTTFNNLAATIGETKDNFFAEKKTENGVVQGFDRVMWQRTFTATPTVSDDSKIAIAVQVKNGFSYVKDSDGKQETVSRLPAQAKLLTDFKWQEMSMAAQPDNGATIQFDAGGDLIEASTEEVKTTGRHIVLFITPRVIARIDDPIADDATSSTR